MRSFELAKDNLTKLNLSPGSYPQIRDENSDIAVM